MKKFFTHTALALVLAASAFTATAHAAGNDINLSAFPAVQSTFDDFVEEAATAVAYDPLAPAEPEGLLGFQLGVSLSTVNIDSTLWNNAVADGSAPSTLLVPRLHARKGLPFGIDIAASYTAVPSTNISVLGAEVRKAILSGSTVTPAVGVTAHYATLTGVSDLDLDTYGFGLGISKGVLMLTPYAGVDQVWYKGSENAGIGLADAKDSFTRAHAGVKFSVALINFIVQADFGPTNTYSLRANVGL